MYDETAFPLVESVIQGYNGTIFAYGQTGCGKTHTMMGQNASAEAKGIIPSAFEHIYSFVDSAANENKKFLIRCSYLEIYNEDIRDLLGDVDRKLDLKENEKKAVFVKDLNIITVKNVADIEKLMLKGMSLRKTG